MTASPKTRPGKGRLSRWVLGGLVLVAMILGVTGYAIRPREKVPTPPGENLDDLEPAVRDLVFGRELVLADPRSATAWGSLGEVLLANDLEEESGECFRQAELLDPTDPRWPYFLGSSLLLHGEHEAALPYLRKAVDRSRPDQWTPRLLLGETLMTLGRGEEAARWFHEVRAVRPDDTRTLFDLGLLAFSRREWEKARDLLLRCLGSPDAQQRSRSRLALVYGRLGDPKAAAEYQAQARRLPKDNDWPDPFVEGYLQWAVKKKNRFRYIDQLTAGRRFADAVALLEPMVEQYPEDHVPALTLGKVLMQMGDIDAAEPVLRKANRLAPDKAQTHYYLSLILYMRGEVLRAQKGADPALAQGIYRESAERARRAIELQPDYGFAHMSLGLALKRLGRWPDAIAELRQAVLCGPEIAETHYYLGDALAERGHVAEARSRLEYALRIAGPNVSWRPTALARLESLPKSEPKKDESKSK